MERPACASSSASGDPFVQHQATIFYVPPLRIVAPPGVPPYLPHPFDPFTFANGIRQEPFSYNVEVAPSVTFPSTATPQAGSSQHPCKYMKAAQTKGEDDSVKANAFSSSTSASPQVPEVSRNHFRNEHLSDPSMGSSEKKRSRESKPRRPVAVRPATTGLSGAISPHKGVVNVLRLYDALRRNLLLDEECKDKDASKGSRPDLQAGSIIGSKGLMVNRDKKYIGSVPGIEVGDQFYFRMELCCVGMHGPIQGGIEYLTARESEYATPVATSVISSGGYDAIDDGEELVYTGQGGKSAVDSKPCEDQKLERGNLAMEGSMKHQVPVRVTRGIKDGASPSGKTYTYDGLYMVEQCWSEKGKSGFEEFKFKLRRVPGQPQLGSAVLKLSNTLKCKPGSREGLRLGDITNGKEAMPICVVNTINSLQGPSPFEYSSSLQYSQGSTYHEFGTAEGCDCIGACLASQSCTCFRENGNTFAYLNGGILVKERGAIFECGSSCRCSLSCRNRFTQKPLKYRLEVFMTEDRGWGLRSWDTISAGSFICEYAGRLVRDGELPQSREYVLDVSKLPQNSPPWGDISHLLEAQSAQATGIPFRSNMVIDSGEIGNASRFINHSCSPNVLAQYIVRENQGMRRPHVMLFAMDNIPPFREFLLKYGTDLPVSDSAVVGKNCLCRSEECKGTFYQ